MRDGRGITDQKSIIPLFLRKKYVLFTNAPPPYSTYFLKNPILDVNIWYDK